MDTLSAYADSASDRQMDTSSKLTNIADQRDPRHDCYKGCEIICVCFKVNPTLEMIFFLNNTQARSTLVIVVEQIEH